MNYSQSKRQESSVKPRPRGQEKGPGQARDPTRSRHTGVDSDRRAARGARCRGRGAMELLHVTVAAFYTVLLGCQPRLLRAQIKSEASCSASSPAKLFGQKGENFTFFCSVSNMPNSTTLNWYKYFNNHKDKFAELKKEDDKYHEGRHHVSKCSNSVFKITILELQLNDTGEYFYEAIELSTSAKIWRSNCTLLNVTARTPGPSTAPPKIISIKKGNVQGTVILSSSIVAVALLLLLGWVLYAIAQKRKGINKSENDDLTLKGEPTSRPVFTVDYGELEFQRGEKPPKTVGTCTSEQTEYATIIFLPEKPLAHNGLQIKK
uniref:Programmed cell death 1 n=2 Tax=Ornithorhynchus anatinus TaxID=9258 RepID=K7E8V1_ORNAN